MIECNNGNLLRYCVPILIKLKEFVEEGKVLLLLDGLDEVPGTDGDEVVKQIEMFVRNYDRNHLIITCRIQAQKYRFNHFAYVEVADFNSEQIAAFARKWFVATARNGAQEGLAKVRQFIKSSPIPLVDAVQL